MFCSRQSAARQVPAISHYSAWQAGKKNVVRVPCRLHVLQTPSPVLPRGPLPVDDVCDPGVRRRRALFYISLPKSVIIEDASNALPPRSRTYSINASTSLIRLMGERYSDDMWG